MRPLPESRLRSRLVKAIVAALDRLELNLAGLGVLTEAATGMYAATPVIAALAGAEVLAYARGLPLSSLGPVPVVRLQAAGLKCAEVMLSRAQEDYRGIAQWVLGSSRQPCAP